MIANSPFIAQNVYWSPLFEEEVGGIGPLGIDAEEQKQGYGLGDRSSSHGLFARTKY